MKRILRNGRAARAEAKGGKMNELIAVLLLVVGAFVAFATSEVAREFERHLDAPAEEAHE